MELLSEPEPAFPQFIVKGLAVLPMRGDESEIVGKVLEIIKARGYRWLESLESELIVGFPNDGRVRALALELCETRHPPIDAIAKSFANDAQLRPSVLEHLVSIPATLRADVIDTLVKTNSDFELILPTLEQYDTERDFEIKTLGSIAYHRTVLRSGAEITGALATLSETVASYGPDHESRRQAALAGAIVLKRLDVMDQLETIGNSRPIFVRMDHVGQLNVPLLRVVGAHWPALRVKFGNDLSTRLVYERDSHELLEALAVVASEFPVVQEEIWNLDQTFLVLPDMLKLLASVRPKSETLKERCLAAIRRDDGTWGGVQRANVAAMIVADEFGEDTTMKDRIVGGKPIDMLSEGEVIALGLGWPEDKIVDQLDAAFRDGKLRMSIYGQLAVFYARIPSSKFAMVLSDQLGHPSMNDFHVRESIQGPVQRRIRRDSEVRNALVEVLRRGASTDGKATFPRLLAGASVPDERLLDWVKGELKSQLAMTSGAELGFDLLEGTVRFVSQCLLDVMDS